MSKGNNYYVIKSDRGLTYASSKVNSKEAARDWRKAGHLNVTIEYVVRSAPKATERDLNGGAPWQ